jgi:GNAT superfamily N-acetyltransferase
MAAIERARAGGLAGLRLRPYAGEADLPAFARVQNAELEADGLPGRTSVEELAAEFAHANESFDPARDVTVAEVDGQVVGTGWRSVVDTTDGFREYRMDGVVDPAWRRRGIGAALFAENERRHSARISAQPTACRARSSAHGAGTRRPATPVC